jgi:vacuolar-type H+-ATPase subunit I/STV1
MKYLWILLLSIPLFGQTTYTEAEALEMIKQRDAQWESKLSKLESIDSAKTVQIGQYEELIGELVTLSKTDSTLLSKKDEQIESLKEQNEANEELAKLAKPSWYENKWLYFGYGAAAIIIPTYFGIKIVDIAN